MPLIKGFKSTTIWKAFLLNSIVATLVIFIAITVKNQFDRYQDSKTKNIIRVKMTFKSVVLTLLATFSASMVAYIFMYFLVGYGGGQLANNIS
jgi:hypothetical protein